MYNDNCQKSPENEIKNIKLEKDINLFTKFTKFLLPVFLQAMFYTKLWVFHY